MKVSVKMEIMVNLTLTARLSLQKSEQAAAFLRQTSPAALSQNVLWCPHDVAGKFFHTYNFKKGKISTWFQLPSNFSVRKYLSNTDLLSYLIAGTRLCMQGENPQIKLNEVNLPVNGFLLIMIKILNHLSHLTTEVLI